MTSISEDASSVMSPVEFLNKQISAAFIASGLKLSNLYNNSTLSLFSSKIKPQAPDKDTEPVAKINKRMPNKNVKKDKITKIVLPHYS